MHNNLFIYFLHRLTKYFLFHQAILQNYFIISNEPLFEQLVQKK